MSIYTQSVTNISRKYVISYSNPGIVKTNQVIKTDFQLSPIANLSKVINNNDFKSLAMESEKTFLDI